MDYKELEEVLGSDGYIHHLIVVMVSNCGAGGDS